MMEKLKAHFERLTYIYVIFYEQCKALLKKKKKGNVKVLDSKLLRVKYFLFFFFQVSMTD